MPSKNMSQRNESSSAPQIINSNMDRGSSVNASVLTATKEIFLRPYIQNYAAELQTVQGVTWLNTKESYNPKTLQAIYKTYKNIRLVV